VEAVILLPENLFYNTTAPGIILVINKFKPIERRAQIMLINASKLFKKGRPKNYLPDESIKQISDLYLNWEAEEGISTIITKDEAAKNDYNLSPSRYVAQNGEDDTLPLEDAVVQLKEAEEERLEADSKLQEILRALGFDHE
jgi:type I restriction enzyme M protein